MDKLTKSDILHVAGLANLDLTDSEIKEFTPQLSNIINFIGELSKADTKGVEPTSQTTGLEDVTRKDEKNSSSSLTQDEALSGTDKFYNGYFKVKAILSERTDK